MVDFGYDISDFKAIDPIFGTIEDLKSLIETAHQYGIRVVLDFIPNHSSDQGPSINHVDRFLCPPPPCGQIWFFGRSLPPRKLK